MRRLTTNSLSETAASWYTIIATNAYLEGIDQTLESWRPNRNEERWKMRSKECVDYLGSIQDDETREKLRKAHSRGKPCKAI